MSARNPLTRIKESVFTAFNRAYHVKKMRDTGQIVDHLYDELEVMISPKLIKEMIKAWIRDLITSRLEQTDFFTEQLDLFRDLDYQFAFKDGRRTYQCALGDLRLAEIISLQHRKNNHIEAAVRERDRFDRAVAIVRPLLEANPDWLWRDAVAHLEANGGVPDIG